MDSRGIIYFLMLSSGRTQNTKISLFTRIGSLRNTTTPNTTIGNVIYFVVLGLITAGLRKATGMEVVSFAILLMNLFVPLIDKFIINKPFGYKKAKGVK